ncbi:MAG: sugar ABC transporter permease [Armatimonadota bacterium]|nr:sugar ABC transporter permease [bacterium]MDW8289995.1 sugar ABC transporter permease [Armatimonadota bacterium]
MKRTRDRWRDLTGWLFVSPWLLGFLLFTLYPILASLYYSFCDYRVLSPPKWVGLSNYVALLTDRDYFLPSLGNTLFMLIELPLALVIGLAMALLLNHKIPGIGVFRTIYYLPSVMPVVAVAVLWLWVLNPQYGLLNAILTPVLAPLGLQPPGWLADPAWAKPAFIMMDLWAVGGSVVIYLASLQNVPAHLYEAAEIDGASAWHKTIHITLPMISPVIFYNLVMGVIWTFQYFTQTFIMTQGGPQNATLFYALYLFYNAFRDFRMGYACAMAWILFLLTLIATLIVFRTSARWVYYEGERR